MRSWNPSMPRGSRLEGFIHKTPPVALAGAAVKLRLLCDEDLGMPAGDSAAHVTAVRQLLELLEQEAHQ
jgi:hypothetical protein